MIEILVVHPEYARQGLGRNMIKKSVELAKEREFTLIIAETTSSYTRRIVEKLGFTKVYDTEFAEKYDNYLDMPDEVIKTHPSCSSYVQEVRSMSFQ